MTDATRSLTPENHPKNAALKPTCNIRIPEEIKPQDGRFGSGPSKVRKQQIEDINQHWQTLLGTSHRQPPVLNLVKKNSRRYRKFLFFARWL